MTNEPLTEEEVISALRLAAAEAKEVMCLATHPVYRVQCLRNIGHEGLHWFTARWEDGLTFDEALRQAVRGRRTQ